MRSQHVEDLAIPPPHGHGSIRSLEVADCLGPFTSRRVAGNLIAGRLGVLKLGRVCVGEFLLLRRPVVQIPVVLVEEEIELVEQRAR